MMSSAQEPHLLPPPKQKLSPLELRNTDLVSRLLAATPPYLYNMSLLPNTYFFSEMLRSFVQAKNEQRGNVVNGFAAANNMFYGHHVRRSRKRGWNNVGRENYQQNTATVEEKVEKTSEKAENNEPWMIRSMRKHEESALELTTNVGNPNHISHEKLEDHQHPKAPKLEEPPPPFSPQQQENTSNLVLPPPPPIWYPPIYPTPPYGIDPLHFFIDLRVSGHIYDRQNNGQTKDINQENSTIVGQKETDTERKDIKVEEPVGNIFNPKRHCSAFSVPTANSVSKNRSSDRSQTKFDVKSMGFDKGSNKTSTNYIMGNISNIYNNLVERKAEISYDMPARTSQIEDHTTINVDTDERVNDDLAQIPESDSTDQSEAEKQKKVKDLRALIGLELVVDYMSNKKGIARSEVSSVISEEGEISSEVESCESPPLEVVAVHDEV